MNSRVKFLAVAVLASVCGMAALAQSPGRFVATGKMTTPRSGHTATLLKDGRVLITGGYQQDARGKGSDLASAELYDPSTGTFTPTGDMTTSRESHTATLLSDDRVLIVGGLSEAMSSASSSEVYDPATGIFTRSGNMTAPHHWLSANLLSDGKVLISGRPTLELYDPASGTFTALGPSSTYGSNSAALLTDGRRSRCFTLCHEQRFAQPRCQRARQRILVSYHHPAAKRQSINCGRRRRCVRPDNQ